MDFESAQAAQAHYRIDYCLKRAESAFQLENYKSAAEWSLFLLAGANSCLLVRRYTKCFEKNASRQQRHKAHCGRALALMKVKKYKDAIDDADRAVEMFPGDIRVVVQAVHRTTSAS